MKKGAIFISVAIFLFFFSTSIVLASYTPIGGFFGGKIISNKAMEVEFKEWAGFECIVLGSSITIYPIGSPPGTPTSYFIPWGVTSAFPTMPGQFILGIYSGKSTITCILKSNPPIIETILLDTITLYGNSSGVKNEKSNKAAKAVPARPAVAPN